MQSKTGQKNGLSKFIRNNLALVIIILCLLAITAIIIVAGIKSNQPVLPVDNPPDDGNQTVINPPVDNPPDDGGTETPITTPETETYGLPVSVEYEVGMDFTSGVGDDLFVYNSTLELWQAHKGVDFLVPAGSDVVSLKSGTVTEVGNTIEHGHYVVVDHGDGVIATYASLDNVVVSAGQKLQKGDKLGLASESAYFEFVQGAHVHLTMTVNSVVVNPWDYVNEKKSGTKLPVTE